MSQRLTIIHWGSFSGTVRMLRGPLGKIANVEFFDLGRLTRNPALVLARIGSKLQSVSDEAPWHKRAIWSRALQRYCLDSGILRSDRPTVFLQTLAAFDLAPEYRYAIYTDRVGREGALGVSTFRSVWGNGWVEREEAFLRGAKTVFVMGPSTENALDQLYDIRGTVRVIGAGPGTDTGPVQREIRPLRRVLFVGTNWPLKGGPEVLEAFRRLSPSHPELELVLVGSQPREPIPPGTRALGWVDGREMASLYSESDAFVVPTHMEALGYSLLEALMQGLPAIGSTVGNQPWLIGNAGITVTPGNVQELKSALENLIANYQDFKTRAIERADQLRVDMTWERVAEELVGHLLEA